MGYTTSTVHGIQVPDSSQANNVPEDIGKVVTALEGGSLVKRLTSAVISALTGPQKPAGLVLYDTTRNALQQSDGTAFGDIMPLGAIVAYGGTTAPPGWVLCNGTAHGSARLLTLLGSANTPDLRDRFIVGVSGSKPRGTTGGAETVTLTAAQSGLPAHSHGLYQPSGSGPLPAVSWTLAASIAAGYAATCDQGGWNASQAHENMPPYYALVYIIKAF